MIEGHLRKSRARERWLLYNRRSDEKDTGSAGADFPDGGVVVAAVAAQTGRPGWIAAPEPVE